MWKFYIYKDIWRGLPMFVLYLKMGSLADI